jgi:hypothetical protein
MRHRLLPLALILLFTTVSPHTALGQTAVTYRLHNEASAINAARQLKTANPDVAAVVRRSSDLKGSSANWFLALDYFETQTGVPGVGGIIPAGSVATFSIWLRKTTAEGTFHPTATLHFNQYWGPVPGLCGAGVGPVSPLPKLTTTFTKYTFTCTLDTARTMTAADRFFVQVGAWVEAAPAHKSVQIELGLEGTLSGNYDSTVAVPLPMAPVITGIAPSAGPVGQTVTIDGANFGATQDSSTVTFNGTIAAVTSWTGTSIITTVPAGATTGPAVVTVGGRSSNGVTFSVAQPPAITSLNPASGVAGQQVTITGANFGPTQGASTITFNGVAATASSWSNTSLVTSVPAGAVTGPVVVTVNGMSSPGVTFTVIPPPSVTSLTPGSARVGDAVSIAGANFGATQGASTVQFNGVPATATSWTATAISTSVPAGATTGPVVVTVNGQTSNAVPFTVLAPAPALTGINPASGYVGDSVTISGTNLSPAPAVTFNGVSAIVTAATATAITATVPQQATTGPVVVVVNGQSSNALSFTVLTSPTGTLTVRTYLSDETAPGGQGLPAGPGVFITIDGQPVGQTAADGTLTVTAQAGERLAAATVPSTSSGEATVTLAAGGSADVSIVLLDSGDVAESTPLVVSEVSGGLLPLASASFTMQFLRNGTRVPIELVEQVELLDVQGNLVFELGDKFEVNDGWMLATDPANFFLWLPIIEPAILRVHAVDTDGFTHVNTVEFSVGQLALNLTLAAPPSTPTLSVANIDVTVGVVGTAIQLQRTTDADGHIQLPLLPYSTLTLNAEKEAGGDFFYGQSALLLTEDTSATLVMRSLTDIVNGIPPLSVTSGGMAAMATATVSAERSAAAQARAAAISQQTAVVTALEEGPTVSVTVTSDGQGEPVEASAPLTVPRGTEKVTLKYNVTSAEFPEWVRKKSPYDDQWTVSVFAGRKQLFTFTQHVNAQLTSAPVWQGDGTTGEIQEELDVKALAQDQDLDLRLTASAVNIKDHLFPTTVNAVLGGVLKLAIKKVEKEEGKLTPVPADPAKYVRQTVGDGSFYSIPAMGQANFFERWFTLTVDKPEDTTVEKVSLTLKDAAGTTLQTLLTDAVEGPNVKILEEGKKIKVRASMQSVQSSVGSTPPPTHFLRYEFVVKGTRNNEAVESDPKSPQEMHALWRMPQIFGRYSDRETGKDDWASRGTYAWLTAHSSIMRRINDISGEHALDLHHDSHARGIDIDMFHIHPFDSSKSGQQNYELLRDKVFAALAGDAAAQSAVAAWVTDSRTGLNSFLDLADVRIVIYAIGTKWTQNGIVLPGGWATTLLKSGTLTVGAATIDTGAGAWTNTHLSKFSSNAIHNSHIHIGLDDTKLIK